MATEICNPAQDFEALLKFLESLGSMQMIKDISLAFFGSFAGAWGAFKLDARAKKRGTLSREFSTINSAVSALTSYLNTAKNYRSQVLSDKRSELDDLVNKIEAHTIVMAKRRRKTPLVVHIRHSLSKIPPAIFLKDMALEKLSQLQFVAGRPVILAAELEKATLILNRAVEEHNKAIDQISKIKSDEARLFSIGGIVDGNGNVNTVYTNTLEQMESSTRDIIFFSHSIGIDLVAYREQLKKITQRSPIQGLALENEEELTALIEEVPAYKKWQTLPFHINEPH